MTLPHFLQAVLWWIACALAALLAGLILSGCAETPMRREPDRTAVTIIVEWSTAGRVAQVCGKGQRHGEEQVLGCYTSEGRIVMSKPTGWDDQLGLYILGHEVFHALGAQHD